MKGIDRIVVPAEKVQEIVPIVYKILFRIKQEEEVVREKNAS